jgi:ABC-type nitrate/sulfonate/bicarbonate transport system permease component
MSVLRRAVMALALPAALIALWWTLSAGSTNYYLPPLRDIVSAFGQTWTPKQLRSDVLPSLSRLAVGFALALVIGVGVGVPTGSFARLRAFAEPVLEFARALPPPVLVPVLILFAGIGDGMKVLVIVSGCVWPILVNTVEGVRAIDEVVLDTCRCYRIAGRGRLLHVTLRSASPQIVAGIRQALSLGIILMVISEMFAAQNGLGFTIMQFQRSFAIPEMWSGVILLGVIGFLLATAMHGVESRLLYWYTGWRRAERGGT